MLTFVLNMQPMSSIFGTFTLNSVGISLFLLSLSAFVVFELLPVAQAFVDVAHLFHGQALLVFVLAAS